MNRKKLAILFITVMIASSSFVGCGNNNKNSKPTSSVVQEKSDKEVNKEYIKKLMRYIDDLQASWKVVTNQSMPVMTEDNEIILIGHFQQIKDAWKYIFEIETQETKEITELKESLSKVRELQEKGIDCYEEGIENINMDKILEGNKLVNEGAKEMIDNSSAIVKTMN